MIEVCEKSKCTGCWACVNTCPKGCISMVEKDLKHLFPAINKETCIDCGLCKKVCPSINPVSRNVAKHTYAAWAVDMQEYKTSTSGGLGSVLARYMVENKGVVYGCVCNKNIEIKHVRIINPSELFKLKGSKYVQSSINDIFKDVKKDLKSGQNVLFVGTPCQIAGLRSFLKEEYEQLFTVDVICHGTPSLGYLKEHIARKIGGGILCDDVKFRDATEMILSVKKQGTIIYSKALWDNCDLDIYYRSFIDGYTYRPSCHTCQYAEPARVSDITIGDFWGLKDDLSITHNYGVSCVLTNTSKGYDLLKSVSDKLNLYERTLEEAVNGNDQLRAPKKADYKIKMFRIFTKKMSISEAYCLVNYASMHGWYKIWGIGFILRRIDRILRRIFD